MSAKVAGFDWEDGNLGKCRKHGVSRAEVEALFDGPLAVSPDPGHSAQESRFLAIGRTAAGRAVFVAFTIRMKGDARLLRPISARYMHRKEIEHYEEAASRSRR